MSNQFSDLLGSAPLTPGCKSCENEARGVKFRPAHAEHCPRRGLRGRPGHKPVPPKPEILDGVEPADDLDVTSDIEASNVREVVFEAFNRLGGLAGLVRWGRANPEKFYQLWMRCGPRAPAGKPRPTKGGTTVVIPGFNDGDS